MLLGKVFDNYGLLAWLRRLCQRRLEAFGLASLLVALATLLRMLLSGPLLGGGPFTTLNLAIIISALVCGFWPGMMATVLSLLIGWYFSSSHVQLRPRLNKRSLDPYNVRRRGEHQCGLSFGSCCRPRAACRSQNLFAVIQAIASRTLIEGQTIANARKVFAGRLDALARTHSVLANNAFLGAPLKGIVAQELTSFSNQATVTGCDIVVNTRAAENFALIIHELVTNALKYGVLSTREGRVVIRCSIVGADGSGQFLFEWSESGGPPVSPPIRKGFGSTILFEAAKQFSEDVQAKFNPEGLTYQLRLLLTGIEAPRAENHAPLLKKATVERAV